MKKLKINWWKLFHLRAIRRFEQSVKVGTVLESGYGFQIEVTRRGHQGFYFNSLDRSVQTFGRAVVVVAYTDQVCSWEVAARHYRVAARPSDSVEDALKAASCKGSN